MTSEKAAGARRPRRWAWQAVLSSLALIVGGLVGTIPAEAATKYPYKPPVEVFVANTTTTTAEITFRTVTGAPIYRVKAVAAGHTTRTAYTGADGNWVITGLDPNTTYTFTVACAMKKGSGYVLLSKESSGAKGKKKGKTKNFPVAMQYPTTNVAGAAMDGALWLTDTANPTNSQRYNGADISVKVPSGFDYTKHGLRFTYAKDQRMSTGTGSYDIFPTTAPVDPYAVLLPPVDEETEPPAETQEAEPTSDPSTVEAPSTEAPATETPSTGTPASPTGPAEQPSTGSDESPSPSLEGTAGTDQSAPASPTETATASSAGQPIVATFLASTVQGYANLQVSLPSPNTNYYVRVQVIARADGQVVSDTSQALLVKTRSKFGFITGTIVNADGSQLSSEVCQNYVVQVFGRSTFSGGTGKDLHQQVQLATVNSAGAVTCDGSFTLEVRPYDGYSVRAVYVGSDLTWQPSWYQAGSGGVGARSSGATELSVTVGQTTTLANPIQVRSGSTITGRADCPTGSGAGSSGSCTVDVAAILDGNYNNVISTVRSNPNGEYTINGLPAGTYLIRVTRTDDSIFPKIAQAIAAKVKYVEKRGVTIEAGTTTTVNIG